MPESSSEIPPSALYAQPWAVRLSFALLTGFTLLVGFAFFDNAHRKELETVSETTALGDTHYFQAPADPTRLPAVGATLHGQPLYVASLTPIDIRDTRTHRAGEDAVRGVAIYELAATASDAERARAGAKGSAFLLKVGANQFVIARPAAGK